VVKESLPVAMPQPTDVKAVRSGPSPEALAAEVLPDHPHLWAAVAAAIAKAEGIERAACAELADRFARKWSGWNALALCSVEWQKRRQDREDCRRSADLAFAVMCECAQVAEAIRFRGHSPVSEQLIVEIRVRLGAGLPECQVARELHCEIGVVSYVRDDLL
jgi:hypothetical protein